MTQLHKDTVITFVQYRYQKMQNCIGLLNYRDQSPQTFEWEPSLLPPGNPEYRISKGFFLYWQFRVSGCVCLKRHISEIMQQPYNYQPLYLIELQLCKYV